MKPIITSALFASVAILLAIGSSPLVFASTVSYFGSSTATVATFNAPALTKVPVTVSFSPKSITLGTTGCPSGYTYCGPNTLELDNKGTASYTFTGCVFEYKLSSASKYSKGSCSLSSSIKIPSGQTSKLTWDTYSNTAGTYDAKVWFTSSTDMSGTGKYTYTVP